MVKGDEVTIECPCCRKEEEPEPDPTPNSNCYEVTGWSAKTIGSPECATAANLSIAQKYIRMPLGSSPSPGDVKSAINGTFTVDCSAEPSGFCRGEGASGTFPWEDAVFESSAGTAAGSSYSYLFEDCPYLEENSADFEVTVNVRFVGSCYLPPGGACNESCTQK